MEAGSGTTDPNSESGSSSNSFTAHMAAGRAAVRDGLTLESPKDENGNTRRYERTPDPIPKKCLKKYLSQLSR